MTYRHGLRASELVDFRWDQIDFAEAVLHVRRVKAGSPANHPIPGDEMRALRRLQREQEPKAPFVFTSERGSPFSTSGFAKLVERAGEAAGLGFKAHPHMLRHACGFALANRGHDTRSLQAYLGHRNIQHTVRYTELTPSGSRISGEAEHETGVLRSQRYSGLMRLASGDVEPSLLIIFARNRGEIFIAILSGIFRPSNLFLVRFRCFLLRLLATTSRSRWSGIYFLFESIGGECRFFQRRFPI